ncbi:MAG: hypothetical protein GKR98_01260 [Boseongicola sp.]|nr:MAG: hypothetical protein GKR98_01260 [Boseongicola sp.]
MLKLDQSTAVDANKPFNLVRRFLGDQCGAATVDLMSVALVCAGLGTALVATMETSGNSIGKTMQSSATSSSIVLVAADTSGGDTGGDTGGGDTVPAGCFVNGSNKLVCNQN